MRRLCISLTPAQKYLVVKFLSTVYFGGSYVVFNLNFNSSLQVAKGLFYLTAQQIIALTVNDLYDFCKVLNLYRTSNEDDLEYDIEEINEKFNTTEAVINAQSWEVAVLYVALLRSNIPISFTYHVSPSIVATIRTCLTKIPAANALPSIREKGNNELCQNYKKRSLGLVGWNTASSIATLIFTFTALTNPDNPDSHAVYPGITEWEDEPLSTSLLAVGVILGSFFMPLVERGAEKLVRRIGNLLCPAHQEDRLLDRNSVNSPTSSTPTTRYKIWDSLGSVYNKVIHCCAPQPAPSR